VSYTYTYAIMPVSERTYEEVLQYLVRVGYQQQVHDNEAWGPVFDMHGIALAKDSFSDTPVERPLNLPMHVLIYRFLTRPLHERLLVLSELELLEEVHLASGETDLDLMVYACIRARRIGKSEALLKALVHLELTRPRREDLPL
jgi:hypothetical protein